MLPLRFLVHARSVPCVSLAPLCTGEQAVVAGCIGQPHNCQNLRMAAKSAAECLPTSIHAKTTARLADTIGAAFAELLAFTSGLSRAHCRGRGDLGTDISDQFQVYGNIAMGTTADTALHPHYSTIALRCCNVDLASAAPKHRLPLAVANCVLRCSDLCKPLVYTPTHMHRCTDAPTPWEPTAGAGRRAFLTVRPL